MDVEDALGKRGERVIAEHAHQACEHEPLDARGGERFGQCRVPGLSIGVGRRRDQRGGDALLFREVEPGARSVGEDEADRAAQQTAFLGAAQRAQVRAGPRDADSEGAAHAST